MQCEAHFKRQWDEKLLKQSGIQWGIYRPAKARHRARKSTALHQPSPPSQEWDKTLQILITLNIVFCVSYNRKRAILGWWSFICFQKWMGPLAKKLHGLCWCCHTDTLYGPTNVHILTPAPLNMSQYIAKVIGRCDKVKDLVENYLELPMWP
jgi:hypothetical protein